MPTEIVRIGNCVNVEILIIVSLVCLLRQRKAFEEERASWLKQQFLNMTTFDHQNSENVKLFSAFSGSEYFVSFLI